MNLAEMWWYPYVLITLILICYGPMLFNLLKQIYSIADYYSNKILDELERKIKNDKNDSRTD